MLCQQVALEQPAGGTIELEHGGVERQHVVIGDLGRRRRDRAGDGLHVVGEIGGAREG